MKYFFIFLFLQVISIAYCKNVIFSEPKDLGCGTYTMVPGNLFRILSPLYDYGLPYPNLYDCNWEFYGSDSCTPVINCDEFKVQESNKCGGDFLEVSDGMDGKQKFCGTNGPKNVTSGSSILKSAFKSDYFGNDKGFKCIVRCANATEELNVVENANKPPETINCKCGVTPDKRLIVGGQEATQNKWKWQIGMVLRGMDNPFCGGALINDRFIITAAHCVVQTGLVAIGPAAAEIVLNDYDISKKNETKTIRRNIMAIHPHPFYNSQTHDYDVAVIQMSEPVDMLATEEPRVVPVCLPAKSDRNSYSGELVDITGWGVTTEGGDQADVLQEATVPVISHEKCNMQYEGKITPRMLCAGYDEGKVDACQGDSGGPLVKSLNDSYKLLGVTSFGEGCARAEKAGVYCRVTDINDWARMVARRGTWCQES